MVMQIECTTFALLWFSRLIPQKHNISHSNISAFLYLHAALPSAGAGSLCCQEKVCSATPSTARDCNRGFVITKRTDLNIEIRLQPLRHSAKGFCC